MWTIPFFKSEFNLVLLKFSYFNYPWLGLHRYTKALDSIKSLRKERNSDLKVDKERLESLSKERSHADKLKSRITDLQSSISSKEIKHEKMREECDELILMNKKFYESATKFREKYLEIERLQKEVERNEEELQEILEHVKEMSGMFNFSLPLF